MESGRSMYSKTNKEVVSKLGMKLSP